LCRILYWFIDCFCSCRLCGKLAIAIIICTEFW
jgi:hypothetical protein